MKTVALSPDGKLTLPSAFLSNAEEVLFLEGAEAIVIKKVRRSVAEKSFEEVAHPFRKMAEDLQLTPEDVPALVEAARAEADGTTNAGILEKR